MIAAALTSPCLIRSDGRTITIEKPQFIECADGRFSAGVAGIPLRHATHSGTDLEQGRVAPSQSPSAAPTHRHPLGRASCRASVGQYGYISGSAGHYKKKKKIDL